VVEGRRQKAGGSADEKISPPCVKIQFPISFTEDGEQSVDASATFRKSETGRSPAKQQMTNDK